MSCVIGIDPSLTSTGIAILRNDGEPYTFTIKTKASQNMGARLAHIYSQVRGAISKGYYADTEYIESITVETGFSGGKGPSAIKLGKVYGIIDLAIHHSGYSNPTYFVSPKSRALYVTGSGNADKESVKQAMQNAFYYEGDSYDEADALGIAYLGAEINFAKKPTWRWFPFGGWPKLPDKCYEAIDNYCK